jgi:hypothetical protein
MAKEVEMREGRERLRKLGFLTAPSAVASAVESPASLVESFRRLRFTE